jgi:hypothetical protein
MEEELWCGVSGAEGWGWEIECEGVVVGSSVLGSCFLASCCVVLIFFYANFYFDFCCTCIVFNVRVFPDCSE